MQQNEIARLPLWGIPNAELSATVRDATQASK